MNGAGKTGTGGLFRKPSGGIGPYRLTGITVMYLFTSPVFIQAQQDKHSFFPEKPIITVRITFAGPDSFVSCFSWTRPTRTITNGAGKQNP